MNSLFRTLNFSTVVALGLSAQLGFAASPKLDLNENPISKPTKAATSLAPIIKKASASVVSVYSTKTRPEGRRGSSELEELMRRFPFGFGGPEGGPRPDFNPPPEQGVGSGVIISEDGYILTNNHVVQNADEVEVAFADGRDRVPAKVVGMDAPSDVAVLKIERKNLSAMTITDSDKLEIGDLVLAIGNPFGVGQTVTRGIVSALSRGGVSPGLYEDFIQTDASINPGNSGGALIDAEGRLVGINTAIISRSGGNQGIGFAIPVNMARNVMEQIISKGKVSRGFLGVLPQNVTPDMVDKFNLPGPSGAIVAEVSEGAPAEEAGIKVGDVILEFNGKKVSDDRHLRLLASQTPPKTKVNVRLMREGKEKVVAVTLGTLPVSAAGRNTPFRPGENPSEPESESIEGLELSSIDQRTRRQLEIPSDVKGVIVSEVAPFSAAQRAGLMRGQIIVAVNNQPVETVEEALKLMNSSKDGKPLLRVLTSTPTGQRVYQFLILKMSEKKKED